MTGLPSPRRHRGRDGLVMSGLVLAVFAYLLLPLLFPYLFVPWAMVGAALVGLIVMWRPLLRRRRVRRKVLYPPRPQKPASGYRRIGSFEKELAGILAATAVLALIFLLEAIAVLYNGLVLWTEYGFFTALGAVVNIVGFCLLIALRDVPGTRLDQDYFSQVDTTEDH